MSGQNESGKKLKSIVRAALVVATMIWGCNGQVSQDGTGIGSETNWLGNCETTGACAEGTCLCGVCTTTCSNAADCGEAPVALCATPAGLVYQATCGEAATVSGGVCVAACESDDDCENAMVCVGGACVTAPSATDVEPQSIETHPERAVYSQFVDRIALTAVEGDSSLTGRCLPRSLPVDADGAVSCIVAEAFESGDCGCTNPGRRPASREAARLMVQRLETAGTCAGADCARYCICEIEQETGMELDACRSELDVSGLADGWCYVDPEAGLGDPSLVMSCRSTESRLLRFAAPSPGQSHLVIACEALTPLTVGSRSVAPGRVGASCLPGDELRADFSGFAETEVSIESGSPECDSGLCLVNAFRGRATCPYGQPADSIDPTRPDPAYEPACLTQGAAGELVTVPVEAQLLFRRPEEAVYCSCRCDGPEGAGPYCACPTGFECAPLMEGLGLEMDVRFAGSYCVKAGTQVPNPQTLRGTQTCTIDNLNCGPPTGGF